MGRLRRCLVFVGLTLIAMLLSARWTGNPWLGRVVDYFTPDDPEYREVETKLRPLATPMAKPKPGDWLDRYNEPGQTFAQYLGVGPVRKSPELKTIYICQIGAFSEEQKQILELTREYMAVFYNIPVQVTKTVPLEAIPAEARRTHPSWGDKQILTGYVIEKVLQPERPNDALAYLAFTSSDLWAGPGSNFVFGLASLRERLGVWSIYRNGDPAKSKEEFQLCLRRTMSTATHETAHILTMQHCIAFDCNMNGSNNRAESDSRPLHFCPVCLRKLCWNLQLEPVAFLERLQAFCKKHGLDDEVEWYSKAIQALRTETDN